MNKKVVIITGGNSGIGLATAIELKKKGFTVYDLSRKENSYKEINHISVDITDKEKVKEAINIIINKEEQIDVLINNAGFGIAGAIEFTLDEDVKKQMDVNFFGMVNVIKEVLPYMRKAKKGRIINISSVAAVFPIPFQTYYSASKAAINTFSFALANEVKPFNIRVCVIMPGDVRTNFTKSRKMEKNGNNLYSGRIIKSVKTMEEDEKNGMSPESIANIISKVALKKKHKLLYTVGFKYKIFIFLSKILPIKITNRIIYNIYAK